MTCEFGSMGSEEEQHFVRPLEGPGRAGIGITATCWGTSELLCCIGAFHPL